MPPVRPQILVWCLAGRQVPQLRAGGVVKNADGTIGADAEERTAWDRYLTESVRSALRYARFASSDPLDELLAGMAAELADALLAERRKRFPARNR